LVPFVTGMAVLVGPLSTSAVAASMNAPVLASTIEVEALTCVE
jgi:hypothetical protein